MIETQNDLHSLMCKQIERHKGITILALNSVDDKDHCHMFQFEDSEEFYKYFMVIKHPMYHGIEFRPKDEYINSEHGDSFGVTIDGGEIYLDMNSAYLFIDGVSSDSAGVSYTELEEKT